MPDGATVKLSIDPRNARKHDKRNAAAIARSLQSLGAGRSIVVDKTGAVIGGNATLAEAAKLGMETYIVHTTGDRLVVVVRDDLAPDDPKRKALALADNRTAEMAAWDKELVGQLLSEIKDLHLPELDFGKMVKAAMEKNTKDATPQIEQAESLKRKWNASAGDLWLIGEHRLLCGDSTRAEDVARLLDGGRPVLMVTDPPYGVEYDPEWRQAAGLQDAGAYGKVTNDDRADWRDAWALFPGDVAYVWHADVASPIVAASLDACNFERRALIVWAKGHMVIGRGDYHHQHEPCWYSVRKGKASRFVEDRTQTTLFRDIKSAILPGETVYLHMDEAKQLWAIRGDHSCLWQIPKPQKSETGHSTQKPIECMARPMRNHDAPEVYDPFLGSGTTMVAAQNLGRKCYGLEISPDYCAVILQRMTDAFPSIKIERART